MFELIGEKSRRSPHGDTLPIAISTAAHLLVLSMLIIVPLLFVAERLPEIPAIMAFVTPSNAVRSAGSVIERAVSVAKSSVPDATPVDASFTRLSTM